MHNPLSLKYEARIRIVLSFSILVGLILFAVAAFPPASRARRGLPQESGVGRKRTRPAFVPGDVLVRYRSEAIAKRRSGVATVQTSEGTALPMKIEDFGASETVAGLRLARVAAGDTMKAINALKQQPDVLYAEPNYILHKDLNPNDPRFISNELLNLTRIGAPTAWNTNTGSSSVVVGVIDQGIDITHEDLQANIWTNPAPGAIPGFTGDLHGYNFVNNNGTVFSGDPTEDHASHVAGIVGAKGNNGIGVVGVNWTVGLMSLKFLAADGTGNTADAIRACGYAKQMRDLWVSSGGTQGANVRVLNNSYGGGGFDQSFVDAINGANTSGILFVAAAGNIDLGTEEPNNDLVPHYPSSFDVPNVVAVASTTSLDTLSSFSHFGLNSVDLGAPGSSILSTVPTDSMGVKYKVFSGTSMATPHVSGAAALLWAQNPSLTVQQVKNLLLLNGDVEAALVDKTLTGRRLNVGNSFQSLAENDTIPPGTVGGLHVNTQNGRSFNLGWTASGDDGAFGQASLYQLSFIDAITSAVIPLRGSVPATSGTAQAADVKIPYRHSSGTIQLREFDNVGNEGTPASLPVTVPLAVGDPYVTTEGSSVALSTGGSRLFGAVGDDDKLSDFLLPFSFPFFGTNFTSVHISTNGNLFFSTPPTRTNGDADDVPSSTTDLTHFQMISGLWDDLYLGSDQRSDAGVFVVQPSASRIIFRWQGVPCNSGPTVCLFGGAPVNFEVELRSDGTIKSRYGSGNTALFPVVGISGGEPEAYIIPSHTSADSPINLTNLAEVTYIPTALAPSVQLSQPTFSATEDTSTLSVQVTRMGDSTGLSTIDYATSDTSGANSCNAPSTGAASSRCDYLTTLGTLQFAAGETTKTISIPIIDDVYFEGNETFTITLTNPTGATLGTPATATLTIIDNDSTNGTSNPIDVAGFFVRQHYVDFLNREPDASGLNFWTNEITSCGTNPQCIEIKRINVSAAFFLSIEFQETGYLVYRMYKSGFGNLSGAPVPVRFNEFLRDTQQIGQGVQVGIGNWQAQLEANKQTFALAFARRPEFQAAFPGSLSADQFVTKLATNAGIVLSSTDKTNFLAVLGSTPADGTLRASVLRSVAEDANLKSAEFNKAFVLMQYFGYLRRNPNDAPDADFSGYNFWLGKLNQFNGNFVNAEMVKAFITSIEYRRRFAP